MKKIMTILMSCLLLTATINVSIAGNGSPTIESKIKKKELSLPVEKISETFNLSQSAFQISMKEIPEFVKKAGDKIILSGWKFYQVSTYFSKEKFITITVIGVNNLAPGWSGCSEVAWGQPYSSVPTNLDAAASAQVSAYNNQGYNCVCRVNQQTTVTNGEWTGYQMCVTITARVSPHCDCIPAG